MSCDTDTRNQYAIGIKGERVCSSEMIRHTQRTRVFYWVNVHMALDDDTNQKRVCTVHKKYTSIYTPYSLSSEFTTPKCGTKPQRLLKIEVHSTQLTVCASTIKKEMLYTPYLLSEGKMRVYGLYTPWDFNNHMLIRMHNMQLQSQYTMISIIETCESCFLPYPVICNEWYFHESR